MMGNHFQTIEISDTHAEIEEASGAHRQANKQKQKAHVSLLSGHGINVYSLAAFEQHSD